MIPARNIHATGGWELFWWMVILALAGLVALLTTPRMAGAAPPAVPAMVPELRVPWTEAVTAYRMGRTIEARNLFDEIVCQAYDEGAVDELDRVGLQLWTTLTAQATGDWEMAVHGWNQAVLVPDTEIYRYVALAALYLEQGRSDLAGEVLDTAWHTDPDNALVHYYTAIYNLEVATAWHDWHDAMLTSEIRLVALGRPVVTPNTRAMARLMAARELERTIEQAAELNRQYPLLPIGWTAEPDLVPNVNDLLQAMRAEAFLGQAHHTLAMLLLDRGQLEVAEQHVDAAAELGESVPFTYGELARQFEQQGRYLDATRGYAKQLRVGVRDVRTTQRLFRTMQRAVVEAFLP